MVKIILVFCTFFFSMGIKAQLIEPLRVVASTGGQLRNASFSVDYVIGEMAITTISNVSSTLHQGFLQYFLLDKFVEPVILPKPKEDSTLIVYELVTPNGDDKNELFFINGIHRYPQNELMIVNKWGNTVFKATNYANTWGGGDLPDGSYFYVLRLLTENKTLSGGFTLAR
jgi:gliding motility-associated-like protein